MADATLKMILLGQDRGASRALKNVGDQADRTERRSHALAASFARVGRVAALGVAGGVGLAAVAGVKFAKAAADDQQQAALMAKQFKNSANATDAQVAATERWITKQGIAKGVADDDLRPALSNLIRATHDVGKAQGLANLAMDVSAGTGKDLSAVSLALAKAQNGNVGGLGRLGIATKDATGKTKSFKDIVADLGKQFGGAATTKANTFQGKMDRLKLVLRETGEAIGYKLLPVLTKMATWFLEKAVPAISKFVNGLSSGKGAAGAFGTIVSKVVDVVKSVAHWIGDQLVPFLKDCANRFSDAMGGSKGFRDLMKKLDPVVRLVVAALKLLWEGIKLGAKIVIPLIALAIKVVVDKVSSMARAVIWLWNSVLQPTFKFIVKAVGWVIDRLGDLMTALGKLPHMDWATRAGRALHNAAQKAYEMADGIKKIPDHKNVKVNITRNTKYTWTDAHGKTHVQNGAPGTHGGPTPLATGTRFFRGGTAWVGERGPEMVDLPRGSRIHTAQDSARMSSGPGGGDFSAAAPLVIQMDSKNVWQGLVKMKRTNGIVSLGLA